VITIASPPRQPPRGCLFQTIDGIIYSIMNRRRLERLQRDWERMRRSQQRASDLEGLAKRLGRALVNRGKHPMWESSEFDDLRPLSIPHHGGRDLPKGTRNSILDQLEEDLIHWEERLLNEEARSDRK
jgi:hypothetical protein